MSYLDMARSHVKELAREAFGLSEVVFDEDGDLPFPFGTAMVHVSVERGSQLVRAWARAVHGIAVQKSVLIEVDEASRHRVLARVCTTSDCVWVAGNLPVETLRARDLGALVAEVGSTADALGSMLAAVHGGHVASPHGAASHWVDE